MTYLHAADIEALHRSVDQAEVVVVEFNAPVGDLIPGLRRGVVAIPEDELPRLMASIMKAISMTVRKFGRIVLTSAFRRGNRSCSA